MDTQKTSTEQGDPVRQFSVMLENRAGALHSLVRLFEDHGIHILGISVQDSFDVTILRLVVSDPEGIETLFIERGISFSVNEILVVELDSGPTSLAGCIAALSRVETNIHISYPLFVRKSGRALFAISIEDPDFAYKPLQTQGFTVVFQNDLSR